MINPALLPSHHMFSQLAYCVLWCVFLCSFVIPAALYALHVGLQTVCPHEFELYFHCIWIEILSF